MKFAGEVKEVLVRTVEIEAKNEREARKKLEDMYGYEDIVLNADDHVDTELEVMEFDGKFGDKDCVMIVNGDKASEIITKGTPNGLFMNFDHSTNTYIGIDNTGDEPLVEEFANREKCLSWLRGEFEVVGVPEDEIKPETPVAPNFRVATPIGTLVATKSGDPNYPGIWICLKRPNSELELPLCLVESPYNEDHLVTRVYGDGMNEEYTERVVHEGIEEYFTPEPEETPVVDVPPEPEDEVASNAEFIKELEKMRKDKHFLKYLRKAYQLLSHAK